VFKVAGPDGAPVTEVCRGVTYDVEVCTQPTCQQGTAAAHSSPRKACVSEPAAMNCMHPRHLAPIIHQRVK
jgi:hypothetical protein